MSAFGFCPGVSVTGTLTVNDEMCPTIRAQANTNTPAVVIRTANTGANGSGIEFELGHTLDTTGPEAVAYAVRMRAGCAVGGQRRVGAGRSQWHFGDGKRSDYIPAR